jgi:recombination protein RecA
MKKAAAKNAKTVKKKSWEDDPITQSSFLGDLMASRQKKFGGSFSESEVAGAEEIDLHVKYLGVTDIAYQWALGRPGYALGRISEMLGPEGSGKTTNFYWLARQAFEAGGMAAMIETELAMSKEHMKAILGPFYKDFQGLFNQPRSFEAGLKMMIFYLQLFKEHDPQGKIPKVLIYDTLAGAGISAVHDGEFDPNKMATGGIAAKARMLSSALEVAKVLAVETNTLVVFGNQAKQKIYTGLESLVKRSEIDSVGGQGGKSLDFAASYWDYLKRGATYKNSAGEKRGFFVSHTFKKNKLRVPYRRFEMIVDFDQGIRFDKPTVAVLNDSGICGIKKLKGGYYACEERGISVNGEMKERELYEAIHSVEHIGWFASKFDILFPPSSGQVYTPRSWGGAVPDVPWGSSGDSDAGQYGSEEEDT